MKNKKLILISIISVITLLFAYWELGMFTPYNYFSAKEDIKNGDIHLLTIGEPSLNPAIEDSITKRYGFRYENKGCTVTEIKMKGIGTYNSVVEDYLEKRNGKGWETKLKRDYNQCFEMNK